MSSDDGTDERWDSSKAVHHANPVTKLLLGQRHCLFSGVGAAQDVGHGSRWQSNDHAREDAKNDTKCDSVRFGSSQAPEDKSEDRAYKLGADMHVEWSGFIRELRKGKSANCGRCVHDGQQPEGLQWLVINI